jgi:hypothetical protein
MHAKQQMPALYFDQQSPRVCVRMPYTPWAFYNVNQFSFLTQPQPGQSDSSVYHIAMALHCKMPTVCTVPNSSISGALAVSPTLCPPHPPSYSTTISSQWAKLSFIGFYFFATREMADHSPSAHFQELFESALRAYEEKTQIKLAEHPLACQLQRSHTIDDITTLLQNQEEAVGDLQASDRIMKAITKTLSIVAPLSAAASLAAGLVSQKPLMPSFAYLTLFDQPLQPAKAIQAGLAILLDVCAVL